MLLGISQPTFFPWIGFFSLLDKIDKFIFLDNIQFEKRSWQQRNCIKLNDQKQFITISVKSKGRFKQKISEVEILHDKNIELLKKKIYFIYKKTFFFEKYYRDIFQVIDKKHKYLKNLNIELIEFFIEALGIKIDLDYSSNYKINLKKENLIFKLCELNKCSQYITTIGSKNYLENYKVIPGTEIKINFFEYKDCKYNQQGKGFIPKLSILDLLFNEGPNSINIIRKGFHLLE